MKLPYHPKALCPKGHGETAAICRVCYDIALGQQYKQWEAQRQKAHGEYLAERDILKEAA